MAKRVFSAARPDWTSSCSRPRLAIRMTAIFGVLQVAAVNRSGPITPGNLPLSAALGRAESTARMGTGGQGGIRTHDTLSRIRTFQARAFDRSATCPLTPAGPLCIRPASPYRNIARRPVSRVLSSDFRRLDDHSSGTGLTARLSRPTRAAGRKTPAAHASAAASTPIRPCSRWGLPCRRHCWKRGALLPHRFTLTPACAGAVCFLWHFP